MHSTEGYLFNAGPVEKSYPPDPAYSVAGTDDHGAQTNPEAVHSDIRPFEDANAEETLRVFGAERDDTRQDHDGRYSQVCTGGPVRG